jgi:hypothetical protein
MGYFGYVTDKKSEHDNIVAKHDHIVVFSDRENIPVMPAISGSSLFHEVIGTGKTKDFNGKTHYVAKAMQMPFLSRKGLHWNLYHEPMEEFRICVCEAKRGI